MVRYTLLLLVALSMAGPARATTWAEGLFEEFTCDFGSVPHGQLLTHAFRIVNNTKTTVHISMVRVSCGCTTARALQSTLAPGQETAVIAQMNSRVFFGPRTVQVYVNFDSPSREEIQLSVLANSRSELTYYPDNLNFGKMKKGTTPTTQVTVTFQGFPQVQVTEVKCDSNYIQAKVQELRRDAVDVYYLVSATARADIPEGKWYTDVWLTTNIATMQRLRVPLTVEVDAPAPAPPVVPPPAAPPASPPPAATPPAAVPPASVPPAAAPPAVPPPAGPPQQKNQSPVQLAPPPQLAPAPPAPKMSANIVVLPPIKAGVETSRKVTLSGSQPFKITSISGWDQELIVQPVSNSSQAVHELTLTFRPSQPGTVNRLIRVTTDMTNNRDIEFNAQTQILPP